MHYTPQQVDAMSLWEFAACVDGFVKANGGTEEATAPSPEEHLAMLEKMNAMTSRQI